MVDFTSSLKKGLDAAKQAEQNRAEVDAVFVELNDQIDAATDHKIAIVRSDIADPSTNVFGAGLVSLFSEKRVGVLAVRNKLDPTYSREVARWKQDPFGYPCKISAGEDEMSCENRVALERGLAWLLALPAVGEKVLKAMIHEPKPEAAA